MRTIDLIDPRRAQRLVTAFMTGLSMHPPHVLESVSLNPLLY